VTLDLPILYATTEELTMHEQMLAHIDTQTKNGTLWRQSSVKKD